MREQAFLTAGVRIVFTDERGDEPVVNDMHYVALQTLSLQVACSGVQRRDI